jgi:hypothetical protein
MGSLALDLTKLTIPGLSLIPQSLGLPPITDFLPPLESLNLPNIDEFLAKTGLPSWDQLGLPPLSELMKPIGDLGTFELPSVDEILSRSQTVLDATMKDLLPAGIKLPSLPKIDLKSLIKVDQLPSLDQVLGNIAKIDTSTLGIQMPSNLPPLQDVLSALRPIADALSKLPPINLSDTSQKIALPSMDEMLAALPPLPENLPSLDQMLQAVQGAQAVANLAKSLTQG